MPTIITLTLNPSLDNATSTPRLYPDGKLRCTRPSYEPGGGGINVARAIRKLGGEALALFPAGGPTGEHLARLLDEEGVANQPLPISDWTRECFNVVEEQSGQQYRFVMPGATLSGSEQDAVVAAIAALPACDYLVISGSLPDGVDGDYLIRLVEAGKARAAAIVIDSSGKPLRQVVSQGGLTLIKPNLGELAALAGVEIHDQDQIATIARSLIDAGKTEVVLVSLGPQGALLVTASDELQIVPPAVKKQSTVGAGDSMVGAVTLKRSQGASWRDAARYGVAAGTAATLNKGTELCRKADVERIFAWLSEKR